MERHVRIFSVIALLLASAGCAAASKQDGSGSHYVDGGGPADPDAPVDPGPGPAPTGLPCDVANVLSAKCTSCHGDPLTESAPFSILSYDDLASPSPKDKSQTVAERSIARMQDNSSPMPPSPHPLATAEEIATLQAWVDAGMPKGTCEPPAGDDAGGPKDTGPSPYDTPVKCTSGSTWLFGDFKSASMHPGVACIACHAKHGGAPKFVAAGTVYPTAHEPNDCNGKVPSGTTVVLTGADGKSVTLSVSGSSGNFSYQGTLVRPYKAKVISGGKTRTMSAAQTDGDCNGCHTQSGIKDAPGRIMLP